MKIHLFYDILRHRAEMGGSYAPSRERTFLLPPDDLKPSPSYMVFRENAKEILKKCNQFMNPINRM